MSKCIGGLIAVVIVMAVVAATMCIAPLLLLWAYHLFAPVFGWTWALNFWHFFAVCIVLSIVFGGFRVSYTKS